MRGVCTWDTFRSVLDDALGESGQKPDAIVASGDLVQDETAAGYERFRQAMADLGSPVWVIPGNHDSPDLMQACLSEPPFQCCGTVEFGNWAIVLLSTFVAGDDGGRLGADRLAGLDQALTGFADRHVLVFMHHQPMPMGSRWLDGVGLRDAEDFLAVVDAHDNVRAVVWGHVHQASDRTRNGVRWLSTPSTCSQFLPNSDDFALDSRPPGYRWIDLKDSGAIDTRVVWVGGSSR